MLQDPDNRYIATLIAHCNPTGETVLEIGCGTGRITRDLARYARSVTATDPDAAALAAARRTVVAANVIFRHEPTGVPPLPAGSFDLVVYTLSLHHVPRDSMATSLATSAALVRARGALAILEPAEGGSLMDAKERFGAGSGDERPARLAAVAALQTLAGWRVAETVHFCTSFHFRDEEDFLAAMLPAFHQQSATGQRHVLAFLARHRSAAGIVLTANRRLDVLRRTDPTRA